MGKRRTARKPVGVIAGHRTGSKRSNYHWTDPEGNVWDSRYEYAVYAAFNEQRKAVRRTDKSDTMAFTLPIKRGKCGACGSANVGQQRTYTPDLYVAANNPKSKAVGYYIEAKGYLRPKERALLRAFYKANPDAPVRYLLQRDFPAGAKSKVTGTRSSITQWFTKFLPTAKVAIWKGNVPKETDWKYTEAVAAKVSVRKSRAARRGVPRKNAE